MERHHVLGRRDRQPQAPQGRAHLGLSDQTARGPELHAHGRHARTVLLLVDTEARVEDLLLDPVARLRGGQGLRVCRVHHADRAEVVD
eukprot:903432-Alexandrium_andersonii.AAC.1